MTVVFNFSPIPGQGLRGSRQLKHCRTLKRELSVAELFMLKLMAFMSSWAHCLPILPIVAIRRHFCAGGWILLETFRVRAFEVYFAHSEGSLVTRRPRPSGWV